MFDQPHDGPRGNDPFDEADPFAFANASWGSFGFGDPSSSLMPSPQLIPGSERALCASSAMDWTAQLDSTFDQDDLKLQPLSPVEPGLGGAGVGRLVAHFENKGHAPPPLPPRPVNAQTIIPPLSHFGSLNSVAHDPRLASPIAISGDPHFGPGSLGIISPATSPISPGGPSLGLSYGSFHHDAQQHQMLTPPIITSTSNPFGSLDEFVNAGRVSSNCNDNDNNNNSNGYGQVHSPMVSPPMSSGPAITTPSRQAPGFSGTPGFAIWRAPASGIPKPEPISSSPPAHPNTNNSFGSNSRPPVPTTPKPVVSARNQFILEFVPPAKAKPKVPIKSPRPRLPPRKPTVAQAAHLGHAAQAAQAQAPTPTPALIDLSIPGTPGTPAPMPAAATTSSPTPGFTPSSMSPPALPARETSLAFSPSSRTTSSCLQAQRRETTPLRAPAGAGTRPAREQVPAEAWEQYKATIRTLYLEERKSLKEVMGIMADRHGFQATPKMYKTRFSQWGFVKNNTEEEVKRLLSMKFQRDAEGKVSEFVRNGRVVNLGTYLKRKGVTEYDLVDFELPADLPAHIRCRTPTPPLAIKSPDLQRTQEVVVGTMRKVFLHCRQMEAEMDAQVGWASIMHWGAWSSELLLEANFFFEALDVDQGGDCLMRAFKQLELDLRRLSSQGIMELILGMINRDPGMMTALCKYLAAYSATNLDRSHPLRQLFSCLYEVQQKHGANTLSGLLWGCISTIAEELEAIYGRRHPHVARTWADLALFYDQVNPERLDKLALELRALQRQLELQQGPHATEVVALRYAILQLQYCPWPRSEATKQTAVDLWNTLRRMGAMIPMRDSRPNSYCFHCVIKVDPYTKRCRRRYDSMAAIFEEHVGARIHPYFEEDFHTHEHAPEPQDAWANALQQMGPSRTWGFI